MRALWSFTPHGARLRRIFGLSPEHPGIFKGAKPVHAARADAIGKHVDMPFDFRRNFYQLENQS